MGDCRDGRDAHTMPIMPTPYPFTHVLIYGGGTYTREFGGPRVDSDMFAVTLRRFNGVNPWALTLAPLGEGRSYPDLAKSPKGITEFLQAGGKADAMTLQVRMPGGQQWGVESVWYVAGHPHAGNLPIDVAIPLPRSTEMVTAAEVFGADEAADLFLAYYRTSHVPAQYTLRPIEGWTSDGTSVDLTGVAREDIGHRAQTPDC